MPNNCFCIKEVRQKGITASLKLKVSRRSILQAKKHNLKCYWCTKSVSRGLGVGNICAYLQGRLRRRCGLLRLYLTATELSSLFDVQIGNLLLRNASRLGNVLKLVYDASKPFSHDYGILIDNFRFLLVYRNIQLLVLMKFIAGLKHYQLYIIDEAIPSTFPLSSTLLTTSVRCHSL